nr:MAG TPA: tail protein [Caudoviricetes sp.]
MAKVMITQAKLEALADALRAKLGFTGKKTLAQLTQAVSDFDAGTDTSDATGGAAQMLSGYTAYGAGGKFTGSIQSLGAQTYQPSTSDQTIPAGKYLSGAQKIAKMVLSSLGPLTISAGASAHTYTPPTGVHGFKDVVVAAATFGGGLYYDSSVAATTKVISATATTLCCGSVATAQSDIPSSGTYLVFAMCDGLGTSNQNVRALLLINGALQYADLSSSVTVSTVNGKRQVVFPHPFFNAAYHAEAYF